MSAAPGINTMAYRAVAVIAGPVYHDTEPEVDHRCEPRVSATCSACCRTYAACTVADTAIRLMLQRQWVCADCRKAGGWS